MDDVTVAVIGASGWMGRIHTMAYQTYPHFFGTKDGRARITILVDRNPDNAAELEAKVPGARVVQDWRDAVTAPEVDLVDICLPDNLHHVVAKAALEAGKHVFCEKPLADTAAEARELADLARAKGVITRVAHGFPRNPVHDLARDIIGSGELGEITMFKGCQHVDVFGDPDAPFMWRADGSLAPTGIVGDTGSHVFSFMNFLVGPVSSLIADLSIFTKQRRSEDGSDVEVTNPDAGNVLCRFETGATGLVDFSRVATGRKFQQRYEVYGTRGSLVYDYDETTRLRLYSNSDATGRRGFRAIDVGPDSPTYAAFLPLPNLGLGYNESKIIEAYEVVRSVASGTPSWPTFDTGHHLCQMVEACMISAESGRWVDVQSV